MRYFIIALISGMALSSCVGLERIPSEDSNVAFNVRIPTAGNSWVLENGRYVPSELITEEGVRGWSNRTQIIRTFFYAEDPGEISLGLKASAGNSKIRVLFGNESKEINISETKFSDIYIGNFQTPTVGYYFVDLVGMEKNGDHYADIDELLIGKINDKNVKYIKDEFYWSRRGPSCHLFYEIPPEVQNIKWFYSEIFIPTGQDVIGSYFMANGFEQGYFGIQVNSPSERRVLFSIWSPYQTDNPAEIPEAYKVKLLKKGAGVTTGEFGNEGSGGQSFKVFSWKADVKYGFLVGASPTGNNETDFTAYFYDPEIRLWSLIASFRRPDTDTYLKGLYSFLENFIPDQGVYARRGLYGNQWVYNASGWHELTKVKLTADNTAMKQNRLDFSGGLENNAFYLKNCGFTNDQTPIGTIFKRTNSGQSPGIDFGALE